MSTYETRSSLGPLNIGIPLDARVAVTTLLNEVLADENILLVKTRKAHWDASGPQFHALHRLWGEQHDLITRRVDQIAERVRMLGRFPIATMRGWLDHSTLHEEQGTVASATNASGRLMRHITTDIAIRDPEAVRKVKTPCWNKVWNA